MMSARLSADGPVATSQELLRSALQRSTRRNADVARRRLWLRWTLWGTGRAVRWLSMPALLIGGAALWTDWPHSQFAESQLPPADHHTQSPVAEVPASAAMGEPPVSAADAMPSLQLRMDAELPSRRRLAQAQSRRVVTAASQPAAAENPEERP
jgi:hypothetical protein